MLLIFYLLHREALGSGVNISFTLSGCSCGNSGGFLDVVDVSNVVNMFN